MKVITHIIFFAILIASCTEVETPQLEKTIIKTYLPTLNKTKTDTSYLNIRIREGVKEYIYQTTPQSDTSVYYLARLVAPKELQRTFDLCTYIDSKTYKIGKKDIEIKVFRATNPDQSQDTENIYFSDSYGILLIYSISEGNLWNTFESFPDSKPLIEKIMNDDSFYKKNNLYQQSL